ncbi:MAG: peptidoglycan editing factor PgeF [Pelotomaculum sp.]|uniref:Purine nucleoside phosphorylase n=1 Tax=Pelotomaculum thermopropionicum (strain DSM 13744 / JCM 10971 / SI) TaxID=370438 RepID=A5D154_PELTS|nr:peptidoglycan editing factor PgeF [Pelotomaculum sp.]BAF60013.1 uncharacterized conserved protein [Pelotomaculum thermopropionicum SI]
MFTTGVKGDIKFYTFPHLDATGIVVHCFTTRCGGVSSGPYSSLNTAFHVGDSAENVRANRALACRALGIDPAGLVAGKQVHGDVVRAVERQDRGRGAFSDEDSLPDTDALVTGVPQLPLSAYFADCVPVFLLDPVKRAVALAHAGWKGTALKIGLKTVEKMSRIFGSNPQDCLAGIGPSVGPCCYEVDDRVMIPFRKAFPDIGEIAVEAPAGRWKLNLWEANRRTLLYAGLKSENIKVARICTSCRNDLFFSYRAQGGTAGRMAALIMLKQQEG